MVRKIVITGTKGKTTVTTIIAQLAKNLGLYENVLHVTTSGHYLNGRQKSTLSDSGEVWGLVPSVSPGRYLFEFLTPKRREMKNLAVLEASLGSSGMAGTGYFRHHVGIFLNVYEDHLGSSSRLKTQQDILEAKRFVISRIAKEGWAVMNADDEFVMSLYEEALTALQHKIILFSCFKSGAEIRKLYPKSSSLTLADDNLIYDSLRTKPKKIVSLKNISWTFNGRYLPSCYNLAAAIGGIIADRKGAVPQRLSQEISKIKLDRYGGRLTRLKSFQGTQIIADYAHEKHSLVEIANLARSLTSPGGKVIGIVRLAYDRTEDLINDTAKVIAQSYDHFIVYDKIDGYWKKAKPIQSKVFTQENGKISMIFSNGLKNNGAHVERIVREDHAIKHVSEIVRPEDVVVIIVNDNIKRSIDFIKKYFNARFID